MRVIKISDSEAVAADKATAKITSDANHRIVFLAARHALYQCLTQAAQQYFSCFDIVLLDQLPSSASPDETVSLVLLGGREEFASSSHIDQCRKCFPRAAIGLMVDGPSANIDNDLIEQRLIRGVLPLSLPLDVWLAVVSLLVSGGEYLLPGIVGASALPPASRHRQGSTHLHHRSGWHEPEQPGSGSVAGMHDDVPLPSYAPRSQEDEEADGIAALTAREREILQLVSQGCQNKIIADRMALSEHTVKAHVHNLIAKLRVTNRTQAAAFLHDRQVARGLGGVRSSTSVAALPGR